MTITGMAKHLHVSTMTIYRKLKAAGVNIEDLRDKDTGTLTTDGMKIIGSLFDGSATTDSVTDDATAIPHDTRVCVTDPPDARTADAVTVAVLQTKLDAALETIHRLETERDRLVQQLEAASAALAREQQDRQHERLMLTGGPAVDAQHEDDRRGWWARLWGKK